MTKIEDDLLRAQLDIEKMAERKRKIPDDETKK